VSNGAFTVAGQLVELDHDEVERRLAGVLPELVREHYVVIGSRRFPPKQVLAELTGVDRADFTTHQARRILMRLGFTAGRGSGGSETAGDENGGVGALPFGGRQTEALAPFKGKWVALCRPTEVLVAADTPQEVLSWLARHEQRSTGMFRVPGTRQEAEGAAPQ
jgi:hypothetical protein